MINEIKEFEAYTSPVVYKATKKSDTNFLGRFTFESLEDFSGFARILTIIARGYMFKYDFDTAQRALCAWCSIPDRKGVEIEEWKFKTDFKEYHSEFPELVDKDGKGWFYKHFLSAMNFITKNENLVRKQYFDKAKLMKSKFKGTWIKKVRQFQMPIFTPYTGGAWVIRFDDILADAKVLGPLRNCTEDLSNEVILKIEKLLPKTLPIETVRQLILFYKQNKQDDTKWVILPVTNFDCYFGNSNFSRKQLNSIPKEILERSPTSFGICRYFVKDEFL